ncbi:hypothetical protein PMI09_04782 [Rhizobium sp. CF122]|uniref:hypothetical protein n=1 Tax=Rhizobium sp. CF122 TaxID=1144312 RepID=UPI0002717590|nr:hypothetical protein [Rhizobium sp. CF122]EJL51088.1 hypothetical protein PMI09_04782 [Rhizobium sp. CF122]
MLGKILALTRRAREPPLGRNGLIRRSSGAIVQFAQPADDAFDKTVFVAIAEDDCCDLDPLAGSSTWPLTNLNGSSLPLKD